MARKVPVRIRIPEWPTVVWKKDEYGRRRPTTVRRRAYTKTVYVNRPY